MCLAAKKWKIYDDEKSTAAEERGEPRRYHIATCKEVEGGGKGQGVILNRLKGFLPATNHHGHAKL